MRNLLFKEYYITDNVGKNRILFYNMESFTPIQQKPGKEK